MKTKFLLPILFFIFGCTTPQKRFKSPGTTQYRDEVGRMIHNQYDDLQFCAYKAIDSKSQHILGNLIVRFTVLRTGVVTKTVVKESTLHLKVFEDCVVKMIQGMLFPAYDEDTILHVTYPFIFTS